MTICIVLEIKLGDHPGPNPHPQDILLREVQEHLKRDQIVRSEPKEFAFTKLMNCGPCGSGVSAEEKYKRLKDGTSARYIYYGCSRARDKSCKAGYMREEDLIEQLVNVMDELAISEIGMQHKFEEEVARFNKFQKGILGMQGIKTEAKDVDLRTYAKYLLREGSAVEKRELLACVKSKFMFKHGTVTLQKAD